jgi:hypothetical protein
MVYRVSRPRRPATHGQQGNRYIWRRGLPREAESSLLSGLGGGHAALLPMPAAAGRLPEGGWVGKRSQRLRGAGRQPPRGPPLTYLNRQLKRHFNCYEREGPSGERPAGGPAGTWFTELAGRGGRLPTDNKGIGIYGGEGCRGKRKVVCYPAGAVGMRRCCPCPPPPADYPHTLAPARVPHPIS